MSPQESIAHYRITSKLGEGGMGAVYRATDTKLNRDVAIKVLPEAFANDPGRLARFTREAKVLASLNHPNIASIYGVEEGSLVMELVEGPTLAERIARGPLPLDEALAVASQMAAALEYAHEKGVVHRDLKPANVKVTPEGRVKVLDFGLAVVVQTASASAAGDLTNSPTLTISPPRVGMILGTAAYMAPEQARAQNVDRRADIWAFGVVLYEMLTGRAPFAGPSISETLAAVLKTEPDIGAVPAELRLIVERCLRKDPRRRWQAIGDVRLLLEEGMLPAAASEPQQLRRTTRLPWVLAAALMVALAAVSAIHFREVPPQMSSVRFQIPLPEGGAPIEFLAFSPDGRQIAFVASAKGRPPLLWIRALDSQEPHALPGTENPVFPMWSPDSRTLAFWTAGKLKKIDAAGGPPQALCDTTTSVGGHWARDGMIYFGTMPGGLFRVPQSGGDPVAVSKPDAARGEVAHIFPRILPDGRHYLYLNVVTSGKHAIYLGSLDGKERKRLLDSLQSFEYAPPSEAGKSGHLLFLREGTLMAQPFNAKGLELAGETFPVLDNVGFSLNAAFFAISANGALVYRPGAAVGQQQLTWLDRSGKALGTLGGLAAYTSPALSRDGRRASVIQIDPQTGSRDIFLIDTTRGVTTRFTSEEQATEPVWSPDGSHLAYSTSRDGPFNLYLKEASGARAGESLGKTEMWERPCDWSPDGRFLMYTRGSAANQFTLWVLSDPTGDAAHRKAEPYLETPFNTLQCQFSPDAHWVAYTSDESKSGREVYVQPFPAPTSKVQISSGGGAQPRWRRDGKELFYVAADGRLMAVDVKTAPTFQAGVPHALFAPHFYGINGTATNPYRYDVSADGQRFLAIMLGPSEANAPESLNVVLNWEAALKK